MDKHKNVATDQIKKAILKRNLWHAVRLIIKGLYIHLTGTILLNCALPTSATVHAQEQNTQGKS